MAAHHLEICLNMSPAIPMMSRFAIAIYCFFATGLGIVIASGAVWAVKHHSWAVAWICSFTFVSSQMFFFKRFRFLLKQQGVQVIGDRLHEWNDLYFIEADSMKIVLNNIDGKVFRLDMMFYENPQKVIDFVINKIDEHRPIKSI